MAIGAQGLEPLTGRLALSTAGGDLVLNGGDSIFDVRARGVLSLTGLTLTGATNSAVRNNSGGRVTITRCRITGNSASFFGGGLANSGGMMSVEDSDITGNNSAGNSGGLDNVPKQKARQWEEQFLQFMKEQHPEVRDLLAREKKITPEVEQKLGRIEGVERLAGLRGHRWLRRWVTGVLCVRPKEWQCREHPGRATALVPLRLALTVTGAYNPAHFAPRNRLPRARRETAARDEEANGSHALRTGDPRRGVRWRER